MNKLRVLVTGASGFVGLPLVEKLSKTGHDVMALSRKYNKNNSTQNSVYWIQSDLSSLGTYKKEVKKFSPSIVIYLSWQDIPDFSFDKSLLNLNQSLEFFNFILELESCKKIMVSGSCLEYNKTKGECKETDIGKSQDHFTWAKHTLFLWLDMICQKKNIQLAWMRIFYVYGPRQRPDSLIPTILEHLKNKKLPDLRTPNNANDFIFIDDVVDAFKKAVTIEYQSGVFNLGYGKSTPVIEICRIAEQIVLGQDALTKKLKIKTESSNYNVNYWACNKLSKEFLKWKPSTSLMEGVEKTWNWLKHK